MRLNLTVDAGSKRPVPYVEAAKNLVRAVLEADDDERPVEALEALARRIRSWELFKRAARQWCEGRASEEPGPP